MTDYKDFLYSKAHISTDSGFEPIYNPDYLYDFQKYLVDWAIRKGRSAIFADCGLGKTPIQLVWADNVVQKENKPVLILTPLAVSPQTVREGEKFGVECIRSRDGNIAGKITVTNYEKLKHFNPNDFIGIVCDESSVLKNYSGAYRNMITNFAKKIPYRLLCTATAAPNDFTELGTSSEALSVMGYMDMLNKFYKNNQSNCALKAHHRQSGTIMPQWRFKKHAEPTFWKWVCSWAKAIRKPSDIGFQDKGFDLPELIEIETIIKHSKPLRGKLFVEPALDLKEQREERRATINERCEAVAEKVCDGGSKVVWCHLNDEGDLLEKMISDGKQVKGGMSDDKKEGLMNDFSNGDLRVLITKPKIGAFGLNWQHCSHMTFFPSHSYEQYYQGVRRCWRFGQKKPVTVDIITTEGEFRVLKNLQRKADQADKMFSRLSEYMNEAESIDTSVNFNKKGILPQWL
jgi:hypothetical protein